MSLKACGENLKDRAFKADKEGVLKLEFCLEPWCVMLISER